jgi:hypothetical protein
MAKNNKNKNKSYQNSNPYFKRIKDLFIVSGCYATTYTFFKIGSQRYIHASYDEDQVFRILDLEQKKVEYSGDFSNPEVIQALEVKISSKIANGDHYQVPLNDDDYTEFEEFYEEQEEGLSQEEYWMVQMALLSENSIERLDIPSADLNENPKYDYFGEPIAYGESDRQWIDYHMSKGNFEAAYEIHKAYIKGK